MFLINYNYIILFLFVILQWKNLYGIAHLYHAALVTMISGIWRYMCIPTMTTDVLTACMKVKMISKDIWGKYFWSRFYIVIVGIAFFSHLSFTFHIISRILFPLFYLDFYFLLGLLFPLLLKSRSDLAFLSSFFQKKTKRNSQISQSYYRNHFLKRISIL